jgi:hypothetical protein
MSGAAAQQLSFVRDVRASAIKARHGSVIAQPDMKFGVVVGRFNDLVTKLLLEGCMGAFESHGANADNIEVGRDHLNAEGLLHCRGEACTCPFKQHSI